MSEFSTTRRHFLKLASAGGIGSAILPAMAEKEASCGLAIGTYGLQSMSLEEAIDLVAETGYDAIELTTFPDFTADPDVLSQSRRQELKKRIKEKGLRVSALMADLHPSADEGIHRTQSESLVRLFELAHDLADAPPLVQTVLGAKGWDESRALFRDRLANWMQIAADQRGGLSIKPHRGHAMSTPENGIWLLEQLGSPRRIRLVYDYSHYALRDPEMSIADTVEAALPWTNYVAVKDAVRSGDKVRFELAGESGNQDHAAIIKAFFNGGYRGDFCCEVSSQIWRGDPDYDPLEATRTCYRNLSAAFEKAGVARG